MPSWISVLFIILCAFCVIYGAYRGLDKAIDWMITKIFDED